MNNKEIAELLKNAIQEQDIDAVWFAIGELEKNHEEVNTINEGVRYALNNLREVYGEGLEETDLWNEYMNEESVTND